MSARVLAVIVCYNPERAALEQTLMALQEQAVESLVVDNASQNATDIQAQISSFKNVKFKGLAQNLGLGYAHNQGIEIANQGDFTHVLLLDQDSVPAAHMVERLLQAYSQQSRSDKVSAVGARYLNPVDNSQSFFVRFGALKFRRHYCDDSASINKADNGETVECVHADFLISSGSLISLKALQEIGLMDQDLFIDHVDTEWFLRAKSKGYKAFGVCSSTMQHGLGEQNHQFSLGGRQRNVPQHKPFRYYYMFRNSIALYKRGYASALWKWNDLQRLSLIFVMYGFVKPPRLANLSMMAKGVWHGIIGRLGKLDD